MRRGSFFRYLACLAVILSFFTVGPVMAATVTSASDVLSTIQESTLSNHTIQMITPTGVGAGATITVTFPTGFALGTFSVNNEDLAVSAAGSCASFADVTLAASPSGATWGVGQSGQVITFTSGSGTVAAGRCIQIEIGANALTDATGASIITNQTAAQNNTDPKILLTAGASDSGTIAVEIVAANTFSLTATVDPSITCSIANTSGSFSTLAIGSIATATNPPVWTISTNATTGYSLSVRSAGNTTSAGLYSSSAAYVIKSADSTEASTADLSTANIIGYGLQGTKTDGGAGSATTSISSPYTSTSNTVGRLQLTSQTLASAGGPVSSATVTSTFKAVVSGLVPPGAYVDTATYVCSGIY